MGRKEDVRLLGIGAHTTGDELRRAFKNLALRYHPDVAGEECGVTFVRIREAYERLRDGYWDRVSPESNDVTPAPSRPRSVSRSRGVDFISLFDGLIENLGQNGAPRKVLDHLELEVPLDYLIFGASLTIHFPVEVACARCQGRSMVVESGGSAVHCPVCRGDGTRTRNLEVPISIPPGLRSGSSFRVPLDISGMTGCDLLVEISLGAA